MSGSVETPWFGNFGQISFGVPDLAAAIAFWERQLGIGPWSLFHGLTFDAVYEGRRIAFPFDVAIAWHDGRVVELMQVLGDGPSPLHDALNRPIVGLQRLASVTEDFERDDALARARGMECYATGSAAGQRFAYYRSADAPGVILELLERTPGFAALCAALAERAGAYLPPAPTPTSSPADAAEAPATMRAARLPGYGGDELFSIESVPVPQPSVGQVRIRVAAAAINPVDVKLRRGDLRDWLPLRFPATLGGDFSGIIDAVGEGVAGFAIGDRVAGLVGPDLDGAYAQWLVAPAATLVRVPEGLDLADAAALPTGVLTGVQLVETGIRPFSGSRILVTGAGGSTGRAAVIAALDAGAEVYAGVRASSRQTVDDLPVAGTVDLSDDAAIGAAGPFDAVADTVGGALAESLFAHVRPNGVVASIAMPPPVPPSGATQRFCSLIVRFDGERLDRFMQAMLRPGRSMPIAHRLPLEEVAHAHRLMEGGGVGGKILLLPNGER